MPSSSLSVEMSGQEAALFQSFQNVIRQAGKFEDSLEKSGQAAKNLSREERAMAREAKRAFEEARSPLDKYNQAKRTLDGLLAKNKISQQEYNAALRNAKNEMDAAGQSGEKAWGTKQLANLKNYVVGITSATAAIALVKGGLQEVIRMGEEAAAKARGSITDVGQLRQVATSDKDYEALIGQTRAIQEMGVDEGRAAQLVFAGRSAGMSVEDTMLLGRMEGTGFVGDTASMARNARALQQAMGMEETGGFRDIVGKSLAASGGAPAAAEQILQASAVAAGGLGNLKVQDEELLAAVASVSNVSGADQAGTQVRSLLFALGEASAKGEVDLSGAGGLMDMVGVVEGMGLDDAALQKLLGRKEAIAAYRMLSANRGDVASIRRDVDRAVGTDLLGTRMQFGDESLDAAVAAKAAMGARDVGRVGLGTQVNRAQALDAFIEDSMRESGASEPAIMWSLRGRRLLTDMWDPEGRAERLAGDVLDAPAGARGTRGFRGAVRAIASDPEAYGVDTPEERAKLDAALRTIGEAAGKLDRAAEHIERAAQAGPALVAPGEDR